MISSDRFYFEDDGSGIPADKRETIFEAGYSTSEDGTGFGLSIIKQIVDAHDWEIHVTDSDEGGARFEITGVKFAAE
jgi:signal transduction histidine kinase